MAKIGRPRIDEESEKMIVTKVLPYLKIGLSLRKACIEAGVHRNQVYRIIQRNEQFRDQIDRARQYMSVIASTTLSKELFSIVQKQKLGEELTIRDLNFLKWFALNSNACKEEFGKIDNNVYVANFDPEMEIQRIKVIIDNQKGSKSDDLTFNALTIL